LFEKLNVSDTDASSVLDILSTSSGLASKMSSLRQLDIENTDEILVALCVLLLYTSVAETCFGLVNGEKTMSEINKMRNLSPAELNPLINSFALAFQERSTDAKSGLESLLMIAPILAATGLFPATTFVDVLFIVLENHALSLEDLVSSCSMVVHKKPTKTALTLGATVH
jgi:hypothetical protein